jgi:hypothetical protein
VGGGSGTWETKALLALDCGTPAFNRETVGDGCVPGANLRSGYGGNPPPDGLGCNRRWDHIYYKVVVFFVVVFFLVINFGLVLVIRVRGVVGVG